MSNENIEKKEEEKTKSIPGAIDIFKNSLEIYKKRGTVFLGIAAVPILIALILSFGIIIFEYLSPISIFLAGILVILGFLLVILQFFLNVLTPGALICAIRDREEGIGIKDSYLRALKLFFPLFWIHLLTFVIIIGGAFPLVIPALVFIVWLTFAPYILFVEGTKGLSALIKSREYIRGIWWNVFGKLFFIIFVVFLVYVIAGLFPGALGDVLGLAVSLIFAPLSAIYGFVLYENVKKFKGDVSQETAKKKRLPYILIAIWGVLVPLLIGTVVVAGLGGSRDFAKTASIMSKMVQLRSNAEIISIESDFDYSDFNCDHPRVESICDEIESETGEPLVVYSGEDSYCFYTKISAKEYYCIDSNFTADLVSIYPGEEGYCDGETFVCPSF